MGSHFMTIYMHYMLFELQINDVFVSLSFVMSQNTGIPIGGSTSAQAASWVVIYRGLRGDSPRELKGLLWLRYRDNFVFLYQPNEPGFSTCGLKRYAKHLLT